MAVAHAADYQQASFQNTIRGHHISKNIWTPTVGEILIVSRETSNPYDLRNFEI